MTTEYASQGVVAIAFHPGGVPGTKVAETAPEWLIRTFKDTRELPLPQQIIMKAVGNNTTNLSNLAALPTAAALYLTPPPGLGT